MPCYDSRNSSEYQAQEKEAIRAEARAATRAACDLANVVARAGLQNSVSNETRAWIHKHIREDQARLRDEETVGDIERLRARALAKLDQDERRALGL